MPEPHADLRAHLQAAAVPPSGALDLADVRARAERYRRRRSMASAATSVALLLPLAVFLGGLARPAAVEFESGGQAAAAGYRELPDGRWLPVRAPLPGDPAPSGITLRLELDQERVRQGEQWWGVLTVTNGSDHAIELGPWECWEVWGLYQDGLHRGGQAALGCLEEPVAGEWWLDPGQSHSWEVPFDTIFEDAEGQRYEHQVLAPGVYAAAAGLQVRSAHHRYSGTWYAPPVRVVVTAR